MPLDNLLADGQSHACAVELIPLVQPLEHAEDSFKELRVDPQPVVLHRECPFRRAIPRGGYVNVGDSGTLIFDGIPDKVLKQLD